MSAPLESAPLSYRRGNTTFDLRSRTLRGSCSVSVRRGVATILGVLFGAQALVSRETLLDALWRGRLIGPMDGIVGVYLCHARRALREAGSDLEIVNHHGRGWEIRPRRASSGGQDE